MTVRAKFTCHSIEHTQGGRVVKMMPVTADTPENKTFWQYTPSGSLELRIENPAAFEQFKVGQEYFLDFTPASD